MLKKNNESLLLFLGLYLLCYGMRLFLHLNMCLEEAQQNVYIMKERFYMHFEIIKIGNDKTMFWKLEIRKFQPLCVDRRPVFISRVYKLGNSRFQANSGT